MAANLDRFKNDLERLVSQGQQLEFSMLDSSDRESFRGQVREQLKGPESEAFLAKLPDFGTTYEAWYSQSLALLRQVLPDRVADFVSLYEKPKGRKSVEYGNYVIQDYLQGLSVTNHFGEVKVGPSAAVPQFRQQLSILKAAQSRFESSLFEIRQLMQADILDSEIDAARELLKNKFLRAAGAIAGVVLERHLRQVCEDHAITVTKKHPTIAHLNESLKSNSVISIPQWRHITMLGDIRNICDHSKQMEPTVEQVTDLIDGADKVLKTVA